MEKISYREPRPWVGRRKDPTLEYLEKWNKSFISWKVKENEHFHTFITLFDQGEWINSVCPKFLF